MSGVGLVEREGMLTVVRGRGEWDRKIISKGRGGGGGLA